MLIADLVLDWVKSDRFAGLAAKTRIVYEGRLWMFVRANEGITMAQMTFAKLRGYIVHMQASKPSCVGSARAALKHFCQWVAETYTSYTCPSFDFALPRAPRKRRDPVPAEHVQLIIDASERLPCPPYRAALYRAAVAILVYGGLRRSEVVMLSEDDFDPVRGVIHVRHGKGDKARKVFMPKEAITIINAYRGLRGTVKGNSRLLQWNALRPFGESGLITAVQISCKIAGVPKYCCHRFRHSFGTRHVNNGTELSTLQAMMGHADLATTGIYLHAGDMQLQDAAENSAILVPKPKQDKNPAKHRTRQAIRRML